MKCDPCTCVIPEGQRLAWCERHKVKKTAHSIELCRTNADYRRAWESGTGPGQKVSGPGFTSASPTPVLEPLPPGMPPVFERARHFVKAIKDFWSDGMKTVTKEQYVERLTICAGCDLVNGNWCRKCGCWLSLKARGRAFECPGGYWPQLPK